MLDNTIQQSTIDRMFIAANVGEAASKNSLARAEFLEILVRIAYSKFKETDRAEDYSSSFEMLLKDLFNNYEPSPW